MFKGEALTDKELKQLSDAIEVSAAVVLSQKRGKAMKKLKPSPKGFTKKYGSCDPFRLCGELSVNIFKSPPSALCQRVLLQCRRAKCYYRQRGIKTA